MGYFRWLYKSIKKFDGYRKLLWFAWAIISIILLVSATTWILMLFTDNPAIIIGVGLLINILFGLPYVIYIVKNKLC